MGFPMPTERPEGFTDNWAYLKTELRWLDQVLMVAVTRQRKETREIERIAQSKADRATSAWWKGIISTEGKAAYDEHRQPAPLGSPKASYQQQLEQKIQASAQAGILLALPALRERLNLTLFEKNLVLMSLAPEINRRYARLYRFLQGEDTPVPTDLPTLDLALRLLCRNDEEWRSARHRLVSTSPLIHHQLLHLAPSPIDSLLNCPLKLTDALVNYLLADQPTETQLEDLLQPPSPSMLPSLLQRTVPAVEWSDLVLPESLLTALHYLTHQVQGHSKCEEKWDMSFQPLVPVGRMALLVGESGSGKTIAAGAIARTLYATLDVIDLDRIDPQTYPSLCQELATYSSPVLLIKAAHLWFGRKPSQLAMLRQFLAQRRQTAGITLFSVTCLSRISTQWRREFDQCLVFPCPNRTDRLLLWQRALPAEIPVSPQIDWDILAQPPLNGGLITRIAQEAIVYAAALDAPQVEMHHLLQALAQRGRWKHAPSFARAKSGEPMSENAALSSPVPSKSSSPLPDPPAPTRARPTKSRKRKQAS